MHEASRLQHADASATIIDVLMAKHNFRALDLLKLDIEGAEGTVFSAAHHTHTHKLQDWETSIEVHGGG